MSAILLAASCGFLLGSGVSAAALIAYMHGEESKRIPPPATTSITSGWSK